MKGFLSEDRPIRTLREVLQRLRESYCGSIGFEVRSLGFRVYVLGQSPCAPPTPLLLCKPVTVRYVEIQSTTC